VKLTARVPLPVTGDPETVRPVGVVIATLVTVPVPAISSQADPLYTFMPAPPVLKYKAPVASASPSLSRVGSDAFAPK